MKIPFTKQQFLDVFKNYNLSVWPSQLIFYLLALLAIYFVIKKFPVSGKIISAVLALLWLWMGIVYNLIFFTVINKAAYIFGIVFILQGLQFVYFGIIRNMFLFSLQKNLPATTGIVFILFALLIYPLIGYYSGHIYPESPTFGLPCPTTIFTFGILLLADKTFPVIVLIIPLLWSIVGFTASFSLGIHEDIALLISGLSGVVLILKNARRRKLDVRGWE